MGKPAPTSPRPRLRCAIYTRKSSEEGLAQEFNSLDAQREACAAFIASQRHEGWVALSDMYDDGGLSGGTMERPALQRLLADVAAGRVDAVVVYKVDRLTRSLADFAKIVDIFDGRQVSFVSVTQAFNTTTSMGRLTLNVLLSFAQFEREVTGERIRDKIAASKRKGMWMGGQPPLGYDVRDRKLVVNETEGARVRHLFGRYRDLGSVRELKAELDAGGHVSKHRTGSGGRPYGGQPFSRGALYAMLQNRVYRGETVHKGQSFPGEHAPIVDVKLWDDVQALLAGHRVERRAGSPERDVSLLVGLVYDATGECLTPTHALKAGVRYRYYVSRSLIAGTAQDGTGQRIPAANLEALVTARIRELLADPAALLAALDPVILDAPAQREVTHAGARRAADLATMEHAALRAMLIGLVSRIDVHPDHIDLTITTRGLLAWLRDEASTENASTAPTLVLTIPARLKRVGIGMRFVIEGEPDDRPGDPTLTKLLARAHTIRDRVLADCTLGVDEIATQDGLARSYVTRLLRLTFLAPDIVTRILAGRQPIGLTANRLMLDTRLPLDWAEQRRALGFS